MDPILAGVGKVLLGVISLGLLALAARLIFGAKKASYADTARTGFNTIIAFVFVAMAAGFGIAAFGNRILTSLGFK